ncbi:hypothetical protein B0T22DRAFT_193765 [Podospora appendiculata]|uniref:DUF7708 domain-containing protein n=1 Tax=Podospora appendiculata TaxID=314037 RepID=A0AAE0XDB5_9PEZI|nr:hypothetical protein B0T22DRAFT_193765 [Podospora appendiculata]
MAFQLGPSREELELAGKLPVRYMEHEAIKLDAAYRDPGSCHDGASKSYVLTQSLTSTTVVPQISINDQGDEADSLQAMAKQQGETFKDVLDGFLKDRPLPKRLQSFNIRAVHSWSEVMEQVASAREAYDQKAQGKRGVVIKFGRYFSDRAKSIDPWLALVPDTDYSSVVCGGLKFVFAAAAEYSTVRSKIMDAIETLPDTIEEINERLENFRDAVDGSLREKLKDQALKLYVSILNTVEGMLQWLNANAFKKLLKSTFRGSYSEDLKSSIEQVKTGSEQLRMLANMCAHSVGVKSLHLIRETKETANQNLTMGAMNYALGEDIYGRTGVTLDGVKDLQLQVNQGNKALAALNAKAGTLAVLEDGYGEMRSMLAASDWRIMHMQTEIKDLGETMKAIQESQRSQQILLQIQLQREYDALSLHQTRPTSPFLMATPPPPRYSRQQLQALLGIDTSQLPTVLDVVTSTSMRHGFSASGVTSKLLQIRRFRAWLQSDSSDTVLLRSLHDHYGPVTALSNFCAGLLASLHGLGGPAVTLHYFCGVMMRPGETAARNHLLRCLTAQLLDAWPAAQTFPLEIDVSRMTNCEFPAVWQLFMAGMLALAGVTVFVVIDGSVRYPEEDEVKIVTEGFMWLQQRLPATTKLKVLLTSPNPFRLNKMLGEDAQVILPTGVHGRLGLNDGLGQQAMVRREYTRGRSRSPVGFPLNAGAGAWD